MYVQNHYLKEYEGGVDLSIVIKKETVKNELDICRKWRGVRPSCIDTKQEMGKNIAVPHCYNCFRKVYKMADFIEQKNHEKLR